MGRGQYGLNGQSHKGGGTSLLLPVWRMQPPTKGSASIQELCMASSCRTVQFLGGTQDSREERGAHGPRGTSCRADDSGGTGEENHLPRGRMFGRLTLGIHNDLCFRPSPDSLRFRHPKTLCEPAPSPAEGRLVQRMPIFQPPRLLGDKLLC